MGLHIVNLNEGCVDKVKKRIACFRTFLFLWWFLVVIRMVLVVLVLIVMFKGVLVIIKMVVVFMLVHTGHRCPGKVIM